MPESPSRTQFPGTTQDIPSSPNQIGSKLKGEFYAAGGLLRLLAPGQIFGSDRMRDALTEHKKKNTGELRKQLTDAGATHQMLDKIDDLRATTKV